MSENILEKIIKKKIEKIDKLKKHITIKSLEEKIEQNNTFINFKDKISNNIINNKISIIAEIKKASPSAGIIIKDYDPVNIAQIYNDNKITCLSVLTEEDFFLGNLIHISKIKDIPGTIVHGRYDMICKTEAAESLHRAWPASQLQIIPDAGHSTSEPSIAYALCRATRDMSRFIQESKK